MFFFRRGKKSHKSRPAAKARRFVRRLPLYLERLEDRIMLSADNWIAGSGDWSTGSNWDLGHAPGSGDTAIIKTSAAATITIQSGDIKIQNITTGSNDTLSITGGTLTVTAGDSTLNGALSMSNNTKLTATGSGVTLTANGSTTVSGSLDAENGASIALPKLTSVTIDNINNVEGTFQASGSGSVLDLSALTNVTQSGAGYDWSVNTLDGGTVNLSGLTSLTGRHVIGHPERFFITDTGGSKLLDSNLTSLQFVDVTLDGTDANVANSWTSFISSTLTVTGGSYQLGALTDVDNSSLSVQDGGSLTLPNVTQIDALSSLIVEASGGGSVLDLSALTSIPSGELSVAALSGGTINLSGLTSLTSDAFGGDTTVNITDTGGSRLLDSNLTSLHRVDVTLDGTDANVANSWTSFTLSDLTVTGGTYKLAALTDVSSSSLSVQDGGNLTLPNITKIAAGSSLSLAASGSGSVLDLSALTYSPSIYSGNVAALSGGTINLSGLTSLTGGGREENSFLVNITDTGGSKLLDSNLTSLQSVNVTLDGTDANVANSWTSFISSALTVTGGSYQLAALTDVDKSSLSVQDGGSLTLPNITNDDPSFSEFSAEGSGSVLDLSALTSVTQPLPGSWQIKALNGGTVNLSGLTSLTGDLNVSAGFGVFYEVFITDTGGSKLLDSNVTSLSYVNATLDGTDTQVANSWTSWTDGVLSGTGGSLSFPNLTDLSGTSLSDIGGSLSFPKLTDLSGLKNGNITLTNGTSVTTQDLEISLPTDGTSGATINVPSTQGLTITLQNSGTLTDTTFNVGQGSKVVLAGGTYLGTTTFNVAQGATVDLTGGQKTTYGGTLTGSGSGTVLFSGGTMYPAVGGVTLNFPGSMFQWTGGAIEASVGDVTNQGTINLAGPNEKQIYADGTLFNYGTIIQTGSGNFGLHSDNVSPTTLNNETGGLYLLESDSGINNVAGGDNVLINAGTIRKTAGSGTSTLYIPSQGYISNTGTIEADSGTIFLNASTIKQVASNALTAGAWNALNGAALKFPTGTSITTNEANVGLEGSGASIDALAGLNSNSGTFSLSNEANFTTAGDLSNSGNLAVGTGSTFTVNGNYTQTDAGTLSVQVGSTSGSGQFGQAAVTGAAALAGNFNVQLASGFTPPKNAVYPVLTFASASDAFAQVTGLGTSLTEQLNSTSLDLVAGSGTPVALELSQVTAPTTATTGQAITVNWQVSNTGSTDASGSWQDSVYLSTTQAITGSSILLGSEMHSDGLAAGGSYTASLIAAMPVLPPGNYYVLVQTDSLDQVHVTDRTKDTLVASTGQLAVSVPALTLGTPSKGTFTAANQDQYYQISVPAGGSLQVSLASAASSGALALYVSQGTQPTTFNYQAAASLVGQPNQSLNVPVTTADSYYILVHSVSGDAATADYTLTVTQSSTLSVSDISPYSGGNAGNVTIEIDGANFTPQTKASLTLGKSVIDAAAIDFVNGSKLFATFNLAGAAADKYTVAVQEGSQSAKAATPFQVTAANNTPLDISLSVPQFVRSGRTGTIIVTYANKSNNDIVAPLLSIDSTNPNVLFSTPDNPNNYVQQAQVTAAAPDGPAGTLRPGQSGQLTIILRSNDTIDGDQIPIQVSPIAQGQAIDWSSQEAPQKLSTDPTAAWDVVWGNLMKEVGTTTDSYNAALAKAVTYLTSLGAATDVVSNIVTLGAATDDASNVGRLWNFLINQANGAFPTMTLTSAIDASLATPGSLPLALDRTFQSTITGRSTPGIFGLGWTSSWEMSLSKDSSGNVIIQGGGYFVAQPNGAYLPIAGEYGTLTQSGGIFTYTDTYGTQYVFRANGNLDYQQDTNGNRITLGYNAQNQLVSLTYSNPSDSSEPAAKLTLIYNTQGFVSQVHDGTGNTWQYAYDSAGHLLSVTGPGDLTTKYTYDTGSNGETVNALLSITYANGSQVNFTYDSATGRLSGTSRNGGANPIAYTYPGEAEVTATDTAGNQSTVWFNDLGAPSRVENALGAISTYAYDTNGNLISHTDAAGNTIQYSYDGNGNVTRTVNALGQTVQMTYGPLSNLTSITDAAGKTTQFKGDAAGNVLSIAYPDGTQQAFTYDPLGNFSETVLQNGDPIDFQYNAQGLVTAATFADGTSQTFTYDAHGNLLTANTFDANGNLTGATTLTYNAANELTSITYPNSQFLKFTYNAGGQRSQSVGQDGYTINYTYDALGRLSKLTDGTGDLIVQYSYNNLGQLAKKVNGNNTSTSYGYDQVGDLTSIVNFAANGKTVNSSFTYTYNVLGEKTSVTDAAGNVTKYGYALGQLTQVTLPDGTSITYAYNAAGDRTEVLTNGVPVNYASNATNEITQAGSTTYTYDANGNLHTAKNASGTTTYTYNDQNQLVSITSPDGSTTTFQYSPLGFLVGASTTSGGNTSQTNYLVDPAGLGNVVAAYNGTGSLIADYAYGLGLVSQSGPSGAGYYDFDASGNTVGITGSNGAYVNQYSYLPFGETTTVAAALPNPFTFGGQFGVAQIGTNLFNMRARNYTPATGQFLSNDPIGLAGRDVNTRRYAANSPVNLADPSGESCIGNILGKIITVYKLLKEPYSPQSVDAAKIARVIKQIKDNQPGENQPDDPAANDDGIPDDINNPGRDPDADIGQYPNDEIDDPYVVDGPIDIDWQGIQDAGEDITTDYVQPAEEEAISIIQEIPPLLSLLSLKPKNQIGGCPCNCHPLPHVPLKPPGPGGGGGTGNSTNITSHDPNALIGPAGFGTQGFIPDTGTFSYTVDFENDGSVAAQVVTVTQQLDLNLDWSTFQLGSFGFGSLKATVPVGLTQYQTTVSYQNTDGTSLDVKVSLNFNVQTGLLTATFASIDPLTGQAPNGVFDGFLSPNDSSGVGEGSVQYTVQPKSGLSNGTTINAQASIVFDTNAAIPTQTITNTIDATPPTSSVQPLPATVNSPNFTVSWSGSDPNGPGIATYTIYVSDNGGPFTPWLTNTTQTSATYTGQVGHTYGFYSVAADAVGLTQPTPATAQASTYVWVPPPPPSPPSPPPSSSPTPPTLQMPPLLVFLDSLLAGIETVNGNGTETVTDSFFGIPLLVSTYDSAGNLLRATLFGIDITLLIELL